MCLMSLNHISLRTTVCQMQGKPQYFIGIYWFDLPASCFIPPALNHFTPRPCPSPGHSRRGEIMRADNVSSQSITLTACTFYQFKTLTTLNFYHRKREDIDEWTPVFSFEWCLPYPFASCFQ